MGIGAVSSWLLVCRSMPGAGWPTAEAHPRFQNGVAHPSSEPADQQVSPDPGPGCRFPTGERMTTGRVLGGIATG
jgi:hypothetical protein